MYLMRIVNLCLVKYGSGHNTMYMDFSDQIMMKFR